MAYPKLRISILDPLNPVVITLKKIKKISQSILAQIDEIIAIVNATKKYNRSRNTTSRFELIKPSNKTQITKKDKIGSVVKNPSVFIN